MDADLVRLHAAYDELVSSRRKLTSDEKLSIEYYREDLAVLSGQSPTPGTVGQWVKMLHALTEFVTSTGRTPTTHLRRKSTSSVLAERSLAEWLRYQRTKRAIHCAYQIERLECVPRFQWSPLDDQWDDQLRALEEFETKHGRWPRYRSDEPEERAIASWRAKQQLILRRGEMPAGRRHAFLAVTGNDGG